jgi:hypothetical protein
MKKEGEESRDDKLLLTSTPDQCIPLGGKSVWSAFNKVGSKYLLPPRSLKYNSLTPFSLLPFHLSLCRPIIMAMANIDSTALFHDLATGADSTASGIVSLIGAALALQNVFSLLLLYSCVVT